MITTRKWTGKWIAGNAGWVNPGRDKRTEHHSYTDPAPYLRKHFTLDKVPKKTVVYLCSAGWHELYVNGQKADDRVLTPCVSQFNVHVNYIKYEISELLKTGDNAITILLGNGLFNGNTSDVWNFNHAPWRDYPRVICDVIADGKILLSSGKDWKMASSPIVFDSLRSGEDYDFAKEINGVLEADFDDSAWKDAYQVRPPAGELIMEEMEPCRICETMEPVYMKQLDAETMIVDFGKNLTGWVGLEMDITEELAEQVEIHLDFGEKLHEDGSLDASNIDYYANDGWELQKAHIKLAAGQKKAAWRPHFTYFGFRYMSLRCEKLSALKITKCQGLFIHNDFKSVGNISCSSENINILQEVTRRSFLTNFTGIPTDCPHREKNGWTGDHSLAMATALWNYDAKDAYKNFLQIFADTQRPSGELAPIAPSGQWWWNCGPAWDYVLFQGAWEFHRFYGDDEIIYSMYDVMRKYLEFTDMMAIDGLCEYGLGDWYVPAEKDKPPMRLSSGAWVMSMWERFAVFAEITGHKEDIEWAKKHAREIRSNLRREFVDTRKAIDTDVWASIGCLLYFNICEPEEEDELVKLLVKKVREGGHKCYFGIFGAKWIPRVLADHGYAEDALQFFLQPEFPGYVYMIEHGATTLWEAFNGSSSLDHIMYGDLSAWFYEYLGGIQPRFDGPAFSKIDLKPNFVPQLSEFQANRALGVGKAIHVSWKKSGKVVSYDVSLPDGTEAALYLPGRKMQLLHKGTHHFEINLGN